MCTFGILLRVHGPKQPYPSFLRIYPPGFFGIRPETRFRKHRMHRSYALRSPARYLLWQPSFVIIQLLRAEMKLLKPSASTFTPNSWAIQSYSLNPNSKPNKP